LGGQGRCGWSALTNAAQRGQPASGNNCATTVVWQRFLGVSTVTEHDVATIPITKRGAEMLKAELQKLKTVDRPWVISAIAEARAQGDLSENAEYEAAKDRQGFIEGRIQEIEGKLSVAQIIDPAELNAHGRIVFGATVELEDEATGDIVRYQIVGEDEADIKHGLVNIGSPIARALIGKEPGDTAEVQAPAGVRRYEVVAVHYV
jgi:transcription elongation factor GreA